jgi:soluble lytic murein transglycosylase-like protein
VQTIAQEHQVDVGLVIGILRVESRFNPEARNRRSGASGLMQVMPSTGDYFECGDLMDAQANLTCGVRILKRYLDYFDGDVTYGVSAYNSGPRMPARARRGQRLPSNFSYVTRVMETRTKFLREGCH